MGYLIGIDVGSQSVKAVLCSPDGKVIGTAASPCSMSHPASGWSEQNPHDWQTGIESTVRRVVADAAIAPEDVSHIGLGCQVDGVVPIDERMRPLRDAIIWLDRRAIAQAATMVERAGMDRIFAISGLNADASHIAPKIMWLRDEEPETYRAAHLLPPVGGFLTGWLTGRAVQDHANASSTLLYDIRECAWSDELLDVTGVDPSLLAPIVPAHEPAGSLSPEVADALGLTTSCVVVTGTGDDHAATLGAGVARPGTIVDVTGTAEPVTTVSLSPVFDAGRLVETHANAVDGTLLIENPGFVSGGSTAWLAQALGATQAEVFTWAEDAPAGSDGVIFVPALSGATAPRWNDRMRGAFYGLSMNHDRSHLGRAVLEGCAYALRDIVEQIGALGLGGSEIRVVGGGARSRSWTQIKSDVTGIPVRPVLSPEPTALGAAMLAAVAAGVFPDAVAAAEAMSKVSDERYEPDAGHHEIYNRAYRTYRRLFDALEEVAM